ncbi:hypothetical protein LUZ60_015098 [Juncus effusus]|nr:hypothetical protein LUZ60_015098 [Juncus effusus]
MWGNRSRNSSSTIRSDTTRSTDFSNLSSVSADSSSSSSSSKSGRRLKRNMSDVILSCIGLEHDYDHASSPHDTSSKGTSNGSGNLDIKKLLSKKMSIQVISGSVRFTWDEILRATNFLSPAQIIGEGGASVVYKGKLDNGKDVAVKRTKKDAEDERMANESFQTEIVTLQKISHNNLVGFYGYLVFDDEKIIVVEFVPYGTLRQHLHGQFGKVLEFSNRLDIIIDIAHGLTYLHTYCDTPLIHRDIKSSNILITNSLHAKVADFGLARLQSTDMNTTSVQTIVKGTPGYVDPDYFKTNRLTDKSDVYSFGVVLVEVVTGKHPIDRDNKRMTIDWALREFVNGNAITTLDPNLKPNSAISWAVEQIYKLALGCLNQNRKKRPSMEECSRVLWNIRKKYNDSVARRN